MGPEQFECWIWVFRPEGSLVAIRLPAKRAGGVSANHWQSALHSPRSLVLRLAGFSAFDWCPQMREESIRT